MSNFTVLQELEVVLKQRLSAKPDESYVASLSAKGLVKILDKLGEEVAELMVAGACDTDERVVNEAADTYFHLLVFMAFAEINLGDVLGERAKTSADVQKAEHAIKENIAAVGSDLGQLIAEISSVAQNITKASTPNNAKDNNWASAGVIQRVRGLLSSVGTLHASRGIDFNLVADELTQRMRHK